MDSIFHISQKRVALQKTKTCHLCKETGHFAKLCKSKGKTKQKRVAHAISKRQTNEQGNNGHWSSGIEAQSSDEDSRYLFGINSNCASEGCEFDSRPQFEVQIRNKSVKMIIDSGANDDVIDEATWRRFQS